MKKNTVSVDRLRRFGDETQGIGSRLSVLAKIGPAKELIDRRVDGKSQSIGSVWVEAGGWMNPDTVKEAPQIDASPMLNTLMMLARKHGIRDVGFGNTERIMLGASSLELPKNAFAGFVVWNATRPESFHDGLDAFLSYITDATPQTWARRHGAKNSALAMFADGVANDGVAFFSSVPVMSDEALAGKFKTFSLHRKDIENFAADEKTEICAAVARNQA